MHSSEGGKRFLEDTLKNVKNISELNKIISDHPNNQQDIFQFIIDERNFIQLVKNTNDVRNLVRLFPSHQKELFNLSCNTENFERLVPHVNSLNSLIIGFKEYNEELFAIICKVHNFKRLVNTPQRLSFMKHYFSKHSSILDKAYENGGIDDLNAVIDPDKIMTKNMSESRAQLEANEKIKRSSSKSRQSFFIETDGLIKEQEIKFSNYKLLDYLRNPGPNVNEIVIAIGSAVIVEGGNNDQTWEQNMIFDSRNQRLILNLDPHFTDLYSTVGAIDTETKKYLPMGFDTTLEKTMSPLLSKLLDHGIMVVICDFRSPILQADVFDLVSRHLEHYREPNNIEGNLVLLQGYSYWYPLFWPTKRYLEAVQSDSDTPNDYGMVVNELRKSIGSAANIAAYFKDNPILPLTQFSPQSKNHGLIFSYPNLGEISKAETKPKNNNTLKSM